MVVRKCDHSQNKTRLIDFFFFAPTFTYDWEFVGCGYKIQVLASLNTTKANLGFGGTFTNLIGASPNLVIQA